ncbi:lipopolysaccharide heptosyltransferase I [Trinickia fusca]|uniref:Lipopolysaccharide heptosyltransferase 1 n=1 Tax=Trinickia fusca TaxID=2419777 RepID=A0A494X9Y2_9BURK|nr:lipopolysaccharide heptosyltransferase I [Trinickia fusca]RKP44944.1 lipopolysaccharide heptosyltransferase I [Trinickia fusca]
MNRVLIVKVTSLGDVVLAQPLVADLHRAFPGIEVDWAADASCADVPRWNPGVSRVLCAPLRRYKKQRGGADLKAIAASIAELRRVKYDAVIDVHGVYKSAIIAFLARSRRRYGYRSNDLGEQGAAFAYTRRFAPRDGSVGACEGMRKSVAGALGYVVDGAPRFDLAIPKPVALPEVARGGPFALLFHATSGEAKKWPVERWHQVGRHLIERGMRVALPWGSESEHAEAVSIAAGIPDAIVLPRLRVEEVAQHIDQCALVVGTDTGFVHLASALDKPTVMIFTATSRKHFGVGMPGRSVSVGDDGAAPSVAEVCEAIETVWPVDVAARAAQPGVIPSPQDRLSAA